jgi:hypothetical protein
METILSNIVEFLKEKFRGAEGRLVVWQKQTKLTKSFDAATELEAAAACIAQAATGGDVYVPISTQEASLPADKRGGSDTVRCLTGFFADVDLSDAKGGHTNYPKNEREALSILAEFAFKPTWIINSGNGLHVSFDLDDPLLLDSDADREDAKGLIADFQSRLAEHFRKNGRKIDSVGDLVRGLRIPGTLNHKSDPPKPVALICFEPESRVTLADVRAFVSASKPGSQQKPVQPIATASHDLILKNCAWYRKIVVEGAATCREPDWFAGASITALCKNGKSIFLDYSRKHPKFKEREAREKFARAAESNAPRTCKSVAETLGHKALCEACPHYGEITSPIQLGRAAYDPGSHGPVPLGYSAEGHFVFLDQVRQILVVATSSQLLSLQYLLGLMPIQFWAGQFPGRKNSATVDPWAAGQALMETCRQRGPFDSKNVRGRGVWREADRIIVNLGGALPSGLKYVYVCFEPLPLKEVKNFPVSRLERMLELFTWRNPQDAMLALGWLAIAPICGVLKWRPHCFVYGPPNCGKTTLHTTVTNLLTPLVVSVDGQSTEAGIRQMIKADSRPCVIDEFESDQARGHITGVLRLARSASSAESPVLRGTPEGKAMHFALRTCFFFAAVNPSGMSPADATRILLLEMLKHKGDPKVAAEIGELEAFFSDKGPEWCGYMAGLAYLVTEAIDVFKKALVGIDSRHRQNVATLLAGAFVAQNRTVPSDEQAHSIAEAFRPTVELHAEAFERDDAVECLEHLLAHQVEKNTLGYWTAATLHPKSQDYVRSEAKRILRNFDIVIRTSGEEPGVFIKNRSPAVDTIFRETKWGRGAWERALRKHGKYFAPRHPVHIAGAKSRAIGLPLDVFQAEIDEDDEEEPWDKLI